MALDACLLNSPIFFVNIILLLLKFSVSVEISF